MILGTSETKMFCLVRDFCEGSLLREVGARLRDGQMGFRRLVPFTESGPHTMAISLQDSLHCGLGLTE